MFDKDKIIQVISPLIEEKGYRLCEVSYKLESGNNVLHIVVDKDEVISISDIVSLNEVISPALDNIDFLDEKYYLDVSSLGIEKPIDVEKLENYEGQYVNLHVTTPIDGENYLEGELVEVEEEKIGLKIQIKSKFKTVSIKRRLIDKGRLAIKF